MLNKDSKILKVVFSVLFILTLIVPFVFAVEMITVEDVVGTVEYYNPITGEQGFLEAGQQIPAVCFVFAAADGSASFLDSSGESVFLSSGDVVQIGDYVESGGEEMATVTVDEDGETLVLQSGESGETFTINADAAWDTMLFAANQDSFGDADTPSADTFDEGSDFTFDSPPSQGNM